MSSEQNTFETLLENYNNAKLQASSNIHPKEVDGKFNEKWYAFEEAAKASLDLALAKIVLEKQSEIKFLTVEKKEATYHMMYNPFGEDLEKLEDMTYTYERVLDKKQKLYTKASNGSICWYVKKMSGPIEDFFSFKLSYWFTSRSPKDNVDNFCKKVSILIRYYPHKEMDTVSKYAKTFIEWYMGLCDDPIEIMEIVNNLFKHLELCIFPKEREIYREEGTLLKMINAHVLTYDINTCSKKCNEEYAKLKFGVQENMAFFESLVAKGLEKKAAMEAKLNKKPMSKGLKRALDGEEDLNEEPPAKKSKTEDANIQ